MKFGTTRFVDIGQTSVGNDNYFLHKYFTKFFFAPNAFQVFLKHHPDHKKPKYRLGNQIRPW